ncbi:hypothetical protein LZ554_002283 [Drepanopeziza brunnea f. sp. 'monogermtubi']|nr:hypothetical protein LZ554_002283 [Drepanopeziza brunnea f. sp. 'monogermtubi']
MPYLLVYCAHISVNVFLGPRTAVHLLCVTQHSTKLLGFRKPSIQIIGGQASINSWAGSAGYFILRVGWRILQ